VADGLRNWYSDPGVTGAQTLLAGEAAAALAGHDALWAWDLGNENSNCVRPPDRRSGVRWLETMTGAIRAADPRALITMGLHMEDLEQDRNLGPREVAASCDLLTMHGYPIYADWAEGGTDAHLVPFLARVTRWLAGGKDVLFSEFGLPTVRQGERTGGGTGPDPAPPLVQEQEAAGYTSEVLTGLREAGCTGAMLWCYADYAPAAWDRPPLDLAVHERSFGLWRADGTPKPAVAAIAAAAGSPRREPPADDWIDIDQDTFWQAPGTQLPRLYRRYRSTDPG
jgi:endo-1,4-beta-mannosidase